MARRSNGADAGGKAKAGAAKSKPRPAKMAEVDKRLNADLLSKAVSLTEIVPYPNNARTHPPAQVAMLADLLKKYGPDQPIVVDEAGVILKGHGRRIAALLANMKTFPVVVRAGLTPSEKIAMRIEDNQVALLSGWDNALIRAEMVELKTKGYDIATLGFDQAMVQWMVDGNPIADAAGEWSGMPHFDNPAEKYFRTIIVHFNDQDGVNEFMAKTGLKINDKTKFTCYPEFNIKPFIQYEGSDESAVPGVHRVEGTAGQSSNGEDARKKSDPVQNRSGGARDRAVRGGDCAGKDPRPG